MVVFTLSCFGILLFLWLAFGGSIPLRAGGLPLQGHLPRGGHARAEADVRLAGVNVGKVKTKELDKGGARTIVELEIKSAYAPIPKDTRAILRQKTLLGETYVELSPGHRRRADAGRTAGTLPDAQVEPTVELDEIFNAFDKPTRDGVPGLGGGALEGDQGRRGQDLNDAFGNLEGFAVDGATLLKELDEQEVAVRRLVKNTGVVFGAINEREGALRRADRELERTRSRPRRRATRRWPRPSGCSRPSWTSRRPRWRGSRASRRHAPAGERSSRARPTTSGRRCATSATWRPTSRGCSATSTR